MPITAIPCKETAVPDRKKISEGMMIQVLEWAYERALSDRPFPGFEGALVLASRCRKQDDNREDQIDQLIRRQNSKSALLGFFSGVGGIFTLPVMIPSNVAGVLFLQMRMIMVIAALCDADLNDEKVKTVVFTCMCGKEAHDILKEFCFSLKKKPMDNPNPKVESQLIEKVKKRVGIRFMTLAGGTGFLNMLKSFPFLGGMINGSVDAIATNAIGDTAKEIFMAGNHDSKERTN